jgi:hypothetical protein
MALSFGWRANDIRESIWKDDPAIPRLVGGNAPDVPAGVLASWQEDGDASHLLPFATHGSPTIITFRSLTPDEKPVILALMQSAVNKDEGFMRAMLACFRIGVDFKGAPAAIPDSDGVDHALSGKERGIRMLPLNFVGYLQDNYPGMIEFYGGLVFQSSFLGDAEKKASSQPSTPTPSSVVASTTGTTAPSVEPGAASGAP